MAGNGRDLSIPWPFAPHEVKLNRDTDLLKLIAMIAMFCDHAGKMLFPQYRILRIIGRLAFPIYAYCLAVGCVYTRSPLKYLRRLAVLALITQPIYAVGLDHTINQMYAVSFAEQPLKAALNFYLYSWNYPSILLTLALGLLVIWTLRERQLVFTAALLIFCFLAEKEINYGLKGVILMVLFYLFIQRPWLSLPAVLAFMLWWGVGAGNYSLFGIRFGSQAFAIFALPLIYIPTKTGLKMPKWLFYAFYPAHIVLIYILDHFVM